MDFRILGPLEVRDGDRAISVGGGRQRALLALLILNANETVSTDRLVDEIWGGERAPATAPKVIQNHISQLRRAFTDGLIITEGSGYTLRLEPDSVDLDHQKSRDLASQLSSHQGALSIPATTEQKDNMVSQFYSCANCHT